MTPKLTRSQRAAMLNLYLGWRLERVGKMTYFAKPHARYSTRALLIEPLTEMGLIKRVAWHYHTYTLSATGKRFCERDSWIQGQLNYTDAD